MLSVGGADNVGAGARDLETQAAVDSGGADVDRLQALEVDWYSYKLVSPSFGSSTLVCLSTTACADTYMHGFPATTA